LCEFVKEEEKNVSKNKMRVMVRDMKKSPSVILKDQDAQYYDKPQSMRVVFFI